MWLKRLKSLPVPQLGLLSAPPFPLPWQLNTLSSFQEWDRKYPVVFYCMPIADGTPSPSTYGSTVWSANSTFPGAANPFGSMNWKYGPTANSVRVADWPNSGFFTGFEPVRMRDSPRLQSTDSGIFQKTVGRNELLSFSENKEMIPSPNHFGWTRRDNTSAGSLNRHDHRSGLAP